VFGGWVSALLSFPQTPEFWGRRNKSVFSSIIETAKIPRLRKPKDCSLSEYPTHPNDESIAGWAAGCIKRSVKKQISIYKRKTRIVSNGYEDFVE
jgi:hypothetical protein